MAENKKYRMMRVYLSTAQKISAIAKILGKTQTEFLNELINSVFEVVGQHKSANLSYESRITSGILLVQVLPKEVLPESEPQKIPKNYQFPLNSLRIVKPHSVKIPLTIKGEKDE